MTNYTDRVRSIAAVGREYAVGEEFQRHSLGFCADPPRGGLDELASVHSYNVWLVLLENWEEERFQVAVETTVEPDLC